jgi:hypothetical protein
MDMDIKHIQNLLNGVESIGSVTFSGGEPSLSIEIFNQTLDLCKENNIYVNAFYVATNGYQISEEFVIACLRWYAYCDEKDYCQVQVSNDIYHMDEGNYNMDLLEGLSFASEKFSKPTKHYLLNEGFAEENRLGIMHHHLTRFIEIDDFNEIEGEVYLNCKGNVIHSCDLSYKRQDEEKYIFSTAENFADTIAKMKQQVS